MQDRPYEGDERQDEIYEGDALSDLGVPAKRVTVVRPSGATIIDMGTWVITVDVRKPLVELLRRVVDIPETADVRYEMDVVYLNKETGEQFEVAKGHSIDPVSSMPDAGVIRTAQDLMSNWFASDRARIRARRRAYRLLKWISPNGLSREVSDLVNDDRVSISCELDGADVMYGLEIWAGPKSGLTPSELFNDQ